MILKVILKVTLKMTLKMALKELLKMLLKVSPHDVPQNVPQNVPHDEELDGWIEKQIRNNPQVSAEDLAKLSNRSSKTIKRHLAKMPHIRYVGSGYSGHWEVLDKE